MFYEYTKKVPFMFLTVYPSKNVLRICVEYSEKNILRTYFKVYSKKYILITSSNR